MKPFLMSAAAIAIAGTLLAAPAVAQPAGPGPGNPPAAGGGPDGGPGAGPGPGYGPRGGWGPGMMMGPGMMGWSGGRGGMGAIRVAPASPSGEWSGSSA
jgi:hypothetical protein